MRACSIMEKTQKSGEGVKTSARLAEEAAERKDRMERLESNFWIVRSELLNSLQKPNKYLFKRQHSQKNVSPVSLSVGEFSLNNEKSFLTTRGL